MQNRRLRLQIRLSNAVTMFARCEFRNLFCSHDRLLWLDFAPALTSRRCPVIDGDTLEIHGQRIRLHAIDAPESSQTCLVDAGQS